MKCSRIVSREQWLDYLDRRLPAEEIDTVRLHLDACPSCRLTHERLSAVRDQLVAAAQHCRAAQPDAARSRSRVWDGVRFRIRRALSADSEPPEVHLERLRELLIALCGKAADGAIRAASKRDDGERFACRLSSIVQVMCGDTAGDLVRGAANKVRDRVA